MSPATRPRDLPPTLGMTLVEGGAEFAVYAGHAESVEVLGKAMKALNIK